MDNGLKFYLSKIEKQLNFHKGLHLFEMEMNPDFTNKVVFLKESQEEYITNLFGDNKNIRESYDKEFKNNVILESTFNPKDEVEKFFSFIKESYIKEINKTDVLNEESTTTTLNEQWQRGDDKVGYWKVLFDQLKKAGLTPKYGLNGKETKDPNKATFIYSNKWVIWKDPSYNKGNPITRDIPPTRYAVKITSNGGKYIGEDISKTMVTGKMSLKTFLSSADNVIPANNAKINGENKIKQETESTAKNVVAKLKAAFDRDSDGVYDDYDGTDENGALAAINLITTKNILDRVNQLIASSARPYGSLKDWVNDEMSDIDRDQYKAIWDRLGSLGYKGYVQNDFLAATGKGDIVGMAKAGFTWLKEKGIPWFFEKLRDALGSTVGAILQQLLDYTGIGAIGVTVLWAALTLFDVWQISSGVGSWAKIFFSVVGLLSAGALAKAIGAYLKPFFGMGGGTISSFFAKIAEKPWFIKYVKPVVGWIGSKISWATGLLKQAGNWIVEKLGATAIGGLVGKGAKWLQDIAEGIVKWAGAGAKAETATLAKQEIGKEGKKLVTKAVYDPLKDLGKEKVVATAGYVGGEKAKVGTQLAYGVKDIKKNVGDVGTAIKKGDFVKTAEKTVKTYDKFGNVIDKGTKLASNGSGVTNSVKNVTNLAVKGATNVAGKSVG